jgi:hypothetical protein
MAGEASGRLPVASMKLHRRHSAGTASFPVATTLATGYYTVRPQLNMQALAEQAARPTIRPNKAGATQLSGTTANNNAATVHASALYVCLAPPKLAMQCMPAHWNHQASHSCASLH